MAFFNGFNSSAILVAAPISTRSLPPRLAIGLAIIGVFIGPFLFGSAVAATIGRDFLDLGAVNISMLFATTVSVTLWTLTAWVLGVPTSISHALAGGLIGAGFAGAGVQIFKLEGLLKIAGALMVGPIAGFIAGFLLLKLVFFLAARSTPSINFWFRNLQMVTTVALSLSHGANDAQKSVGLITLGLVVLGVQSDFAIHLWVVAAAAGALALGTSAGGYRIIRTLGARIYKLRPVHGFSAQAATAGIIAAAALTGAPVSSTHIAGTTIMGVGAAERLRGVRWEVVGQILGAWVITLPVVALVSAALYFLLERFQ